MAINSLGGLPQGAIIGMPVASLPTNVSLNRTYTTTTTGITGLPEFVFAVMVAGGTGGQINGASRTGGGGGGLSMAWIPAPKAVTVGAGAPGASSPTFGGNTFCDTFAGQTFGQPGGATTSGGRVLLSVYGNESHFFGYSDGSSSGSGGGASAAGIDGFFAAGGGGATTAAARSGGNSTKFGFTGGTGAGTGTTWGSGGGAGIAGNGGNGTAAAAGVGGLGGGGGGAGSTGVTTGGTGGVGAVLLYW